MPWELQIVVNGYCSHRDSFIYVLSFGIMRPYIGSLEVMGLVIRSPFSSPLPYVERPCGTNTAYGLASFELLLYENATDKNTNTANYPLRDDLAIKIQVPLGSFKYRMDCTNSRYASEHC